MKHVFKKSAQLTWFVVTGLFSCVIAVLKTILLNKTHGGDISYLPPPKTPQEIEKELNPTFSDTSTDIINQDMF